MREDGSGGLLGGLGGRAPGNAAETPGSRPLVATRKNSLLAAGRLRLACGQRRQRVTGCLPKGGVRARSGMTCSTGRGRRLRTLNPQSLEVGLMAGRSRQLAYSTRSRAPLQQLVADPSSAALRGGCACRRVVESHPHGRGHTTPAVGYASGSPATPSLAATLGVGSLRWTWRARLPSRGGPMGDHRAACARSGLLARRAPILERAWVRVAREAVAAEGRVFPPTMAGTDHRAGRSPR